ncbi:DUF481 domain-containing protein [Flammeovirga sp. MY04]|uniref:DUF481 domain-containing protein n=1 Tax=Flammeovirga sp. MY04 TaxID=1191459 RepID=UPI0008063E9D|nr:DUF481 domain-containing protein [Flammeovirga sp. MY04]ANQ52360.1 DUF481 domain-containing protein [Flammeovirga sp. MY04]
MKALLFSTLLLISSYVFSQEIDTLKWDNRISLIGRHQSGNLNQYSIMPTWRSTLHNSKINAVLDVNYQYIKVEEFEVVDDFWVSGMLQYGHQQKVYPIVYGLNGFAQSYHIDKSSFLGGGMGWNILKQKPNSYLQLHVMAGYLNFQFTETPLHEAFSWSGFIRTKFPISKMFQLEWEVLTYQSMKDTEYMGFGNLLVFNFMLNKWLGLNVRHQIYYDHKEVPLTENLNSIAYFGLNVNL